MARRIEEAELHEIVEKAMDMADAEFEKSDPHPEDPRNWRDDREEEPMYFHALKLLIACGLIAAGHDVDVPPAPARGG